MTARSYQSSCEVPEVASRKGGNRNRLYRYNRNFRWKGVPVQKYKPGGEDWSGILRQTLVGARGESTKFHLRYFEIEPGGYSSFESHNHEHVVIAVRGKGRARLSRKTVDLNFLDVLYIKPNTPHRLFNPGHEPFGFFCVVNARRDRPRPLER